MERPATLPRPGAPGGTRVETPLTSVSLDAEADLVVGDHVVFYNHDSYTPLTAGVANTIWRLENAIVIDRRGGENRYQGHGYFSPVSKRQLLSGMVAQYNRHLYRARRLARAVDRARSPSARVRARDALRAEFPKVEEKPGGGWQIKGPGLFGAMVTRDLVPLTTEWAVQHSLIHPSTGKIEANRAVHTS